MNHKILCINCENELEIEEVLVTEKHEFEIFIKPCSNLACKNYQDCPRCKQIQKCFE